MPTLRRYVRVSKYTVLECRIFLDNPSLLTSWLLSPRFQILPQLFAVVEPLVLPKLREEREAAASAVGKKKGKSVRDFVVGDGFEASIFLVDSGSRYAVMTKVKSFREPGKAKMRSNSRKLISVSSENRIEKVTGDGEGGGEGEEEEETGRRRGRRRRTDIEVRQESTSSAEEWLSEIPVASPPPPPPASLHKRRKPPTPKSTPPTPSGSRPAKRPKTTTAIEILDSEDEDDALDPAVHVEEDESEEGGREDEEEEEKKKLTLTTKYEGFEIWGRVLCIVVKRTATAAATAAATVDIEAGKGTRKGKGKEREEEKEKGGGAGMIEEWIAMSQAVREGDEDGG